MSSFQIKNNILNIIFILDKSGSMESLGNETLQALQAFLNNLPNTVFDFLNKEQKIIKRLIINTFNETVKHEIDHTYTDNYTLSFSYIPCGMTAAFDGIGITLSKYLPLLTMGKTYVVIVSDGHENASKIYEKSKVIDLINKSKEKGWEFIFLGANIDSFKESTDLHIHHCGQFNQSVSGNLTELTREISNAISQSTTEGTPFKITQSETRNDVAPLPPSKDTLHPEFFDLACLDLPHC
jgi:predicted DNA binding CopG/RHH family protein